MKTLVILLFFVIFISCNDNNITQPNETLVIKPLNNGNYWIFNRTEYTPEGDSMIREPYKHVILGDTIVEGKKLFFARNFTPDDNTYNDTTYVPIPSIVRYYYNDSIGLHIFYIHIEAFEIWTEESIFLKYPANNNVTYSTELWGDIRVESTDEKVTVPAGTFNCYKYVHELVDGGVKERAYYYYAPDIGCIKYVITVEIDNESEKIIEKEELQSYKLN